MKKLFIIMPVLMLLGCPFSGFKPPKPYYSWRLHNSINLYPPLEKGSFHQFLNRREKDMSDCGMDFVSGESTKPHVNLCMEKKGWYLEGGPVCENELAWDNPLCIQWRKKHSKPDAKPWG